MAVDIATLITQTANQYGVDPNIALAVAQRESQLNQNARGTSGEIGIFQLMPGTAAGLGVDPYSITDNIRGGVMYLQQMFSKYGNWTTALAAYNAGPGNVDNGVIPKSTASYVDDILGKVQSWVPNFSVTGWGSQQQAGLLDTSVGYNVGVNWWLIGGAVVGIVLFWKWVND